MYSYKIVNGCFFTFVKNTTYISIYNLERLSEKQSRTDTIPLLARTSLSTNTHNIVVKNFLVGLGYIFFVRAIHEQETIRVGFVGRSNEL